MEPLKVEHNFEEVTAVAYHPTNLFSVGSGRRVIHSFILRSLPFLLVSHLFRWFSSASLVTVVRSGNHLIILFSAEYSSCSQSISEYCHTSSTPSVRFNSSFTSTGIPIPYDPFVGLHLPLFHVDSSSGPTDLLLVFPSQLSLWETSLDQSEAHSLGERWESSRQCRTEHLQTSMSFIRVDLWWFSTDPVEIHLNHWQSSIDDRWTTHGVSALEVRAILVHASSALFVRQTAGDRYSLESCSFSVTTTKKKKKKKQLESDSSLFYLM